MPAVIVRRSLRVVLIFDLEDVYARDQRYSGPHPRPGGPLKFWLVGQVVNGAPTPWPEPLEMVVVENPSGYHLFFGEVRMSADEVRQTGRAQPNARRIELAGRYMVQVTGQGYQSVRRDDIEVPMPDPNLPGSGAPYHFDLLPGWAYGFPNTYPMRPDGITGPCAPGNAAESSGPTLLRGSLHQFDGTPLADAVVRLDGVANSPTYTTDASGQWVLAFPNTWASGPVTVRVTRPPDPPMVVPNVCVIRGRDMSLFETAVRGWVQRRGIGVAGATVEVSGQPASVTTTRDGQWAYYFRLDQVGITVDITARLPDGASQTAHNIQVRAQGTVLVPTFNFP